MASRRSSTKQSFVQTLLVIFHSLHKVHRTSYLCNATEQNTSVRIKSSDKSSVSNFVLEKIQFLYKNLPLFFKTNIGTPVEEVLDYFRDGKENYTFCPASALDIDKNSPNYQIKVTFQLILWTFISPFCKNIVLMNVAEGVKATSSAKGVAQEKKIWEWLLAFLKCVTSTARTVVISKNMDSIWGFMLVPNAIQCSREPLSVLATPPVVHPTDTSSQISSFTHALLEYLLDKQDTLPSVFNGNGGWINVDISIPPELRADLFFQQWNHDSAGCHQTCTNNKNCGESAETVLSINQASVDNTQSRHTDTNKNDEIQKELQLLLDDMHEICEQQFEETLVKFTRKYMLPDVTDEKKIDDGRTIGFIYLVTKHCLSHRIDQDDPLFYVMHAIYFGFLHGKKASAINPCKKWQVLCSMVLGNADPMHVLSLSHYIANCVGKKKVLPPKNQALLHFSHLYELRCPLKKDRRDRHCAITLGEMMNSQLLSSPPQTTTPKQGVQGKKVFSRRKPTVSNSNPAKKGTKTKHAKDTTPKKSNKTVQIGADKSVLSTPRRSSPRKKTARPGNPSS